MPSSVLGKIVAQKRQDVATREAERPLDTLLSHVEPTARSLAKALSQPRSRFILEVKKASPSAGVIRHDFDPVAIAKAYRPVASAISVLTDEPFFHGKFEYLSAVRSVFDGPILCKDFVLGPYQVVEARVHGADAVLLMMSVLDDATVAECLKTATSLGMDALVEVHDAEELDRALGVDAKIIGINNRNLKDLTVSLDVTEQLAPRVPRDRIVVAESGIETPADVDRLSRYAHGFLVGSSLMKSSNIGEAARALVTGRVKICGLLEVADQQAAADGGALHGGVVFAERSPRRITPEAAEPLCQGILPMVGVFQNQPAHWVAEVADRLGLAAVQLHGQESPVYRAEVRGALAKHSRHEVGIWQAVAVDPDDCADDVRARIEVHKRGSDRILFDTRVGNTSGGTGRTFSWALLDGMTEKTDAMLAGGIRPKNARRARQVGTWGVDVSSGVERRPGEKDPEKIQAFFDALRAPSRGDDDV